MWKEIGLSIRFRLFDTFQINTIDVIGSKQAECLLNYKKHVFYVENK